MANFGAIHIDCVYGKYNSMTLRQYIHAQIGATRAAGIYIMLLAQKHHRRM